MIKLVKQFVSEVSNGELKAVKGSDFEIEWDANKIYWNPTAKDESGFMQHLSTVHKNKHADISYFTFALLHEIGHYMTSDKLTEKDYKEENLWIINNYEYDENDEVVMENGRVKMIDNLDFNGYFNCRMEWLATEWAKKFVNNNYDYVKRYDEAFMKVAQ